MTEVKYHRKGSLIPIVVKEPRPQPPISLLTQTGIELADR